MAKTVTISLTQVLSRLSDLMSQLRSAGAGGVRRVGSVASAGPCWKDAGWVSGGVSRGQGHRWLAGLTVQRDCAFLGRILRVKGSLVTEMRLHHGPSKPPSYLVRASEPRVGSPFGKVRQIRQLSKSVSCRDGGSAGRTLARKGDGVHGATPQTSHLQHPELVP